VQALTTVPGPDARVSPAWSATKRQTGKVVPIGNDVAIHAYGEVRFFEDAERLLQIVTRLTETHEAPRPAPWAASDAPAEFIRGQLKGIVGLELPIVRLEGKWKMSHNRPAEDRAGAIEGLRREGGAEGAVVAEIMAMMSRE
jgi:transcriptional regulator